MGNLGAYQDITKLIKLLGGPAKAAAVLIGGTLAAGGLLTVAGQKTATAIAKAVRGRRARRVPCPTIGRSFVVNTVDSDEQGLEFREGDTYSVLECDGDAILVEMTGNADNPFFVSAAFLASISDYPAPPDSRREAHFED
ncbi:hypothetical protein CH252_31000 [Rhodococcus sp. 06-1477-1B]|nr:hypothetical protein CH252_31000 [Rhodococcus sp. 06-1477-1B]